ncbi:MAG: gamma-glutamylcyclotransferase [Sphingobacteriales bacterium]|nr:gamma-glutamylcyclotransferase [Sphingobacteriales bacterium]MBI3717521.1 gamma-glutamylcyclotransferase [Sphingobacteriales bacterium]
MLPLPGYKFSFNKRSNDGSGKGNIQQTNIDGDTIVGVVFEINEAEKPALDAVEGLGNGYNQAVVDLLDDNGETFQAQVYIADESAVDNNLMPYDWYKEFVVTGAEQNGLPPEYVENIRKNAFIADTDEERKGRQLAILKGITKPKIL